MTTKNHPRALSRSSNPDQRSKREIEPTRTRYLHNFPTTPQAATSRANGSSGRRCHPGAWCFDHCSGVWGHPYVGWRRQFYPQVAGVFHMKSLVTFPRSDQACWWIEVSRPTYGTMDGSSMAEASIKNQAVLIWSEADIPWACCKQAQHEKTVLLLAVPRRVL